MTQAASDRPPITRLPMANIQDRLVHNRQAFGNQTRELQVSLTSHGANGDLVAFRADIAQTFYPVQVNDVIGHRQPRSEEHTSELQSLMRISYAVFCLKKKKQQN